MERKYRNPKLSTCWGNQLHGNSKDLPTEPLGTGAPHSLRKPVEENMHMDTITKKQFRGSRTLSVLLTVIPLASALIFVGSAAPPAEAHATCNRSPHGHGFLWGDRWSVKRVVSIGGGLEQVFWRYYNIFDQSATGQIYYYDGGSVTCRG